MNLNHLINMVTNQVVRRVVNIAVDRGFRFAQRKAADVTTPNSDQAASIPEQPAANHITTPSELAKDAQLRTLADQAAKTAKMMRRIGR